MSALKRLRHSPIDSVAMTHEKLLDRYAQLAVRSGLNLQKGQQLLITAPLDAVPLVRRITEHAYKAGATLVTTIYADDERRWRATASRRTRLRHGPRLAVRRHGRCLSRRCGPSCHRRRGSRPAGRTGPRPKLSRANKARSIAYRPALELITGFAINWCVIAAATPAWASRSSRSCARPRPWPSSGRQSSPAPRPTCRTRWRPGKSTPPTCARRTAFLNERRYRALKYRGPGTDLMLGLARGPCLEGRRRQGAQRHVLQCQHPDRGSLHRAPQGHGGRHRSARPSRCPIRDR